MLFYLLSFAGIAGLTWWGFKDADLSTLFAHAFLQRKRENYRGKVIWITGASSGIGEQIAYIFAKLGCRLVISGTRQQELERVRDECLKLSSECQVLIIRGDIGDTPKHAEWIEQVIKKYGEVHVLVNNAGRTQRSEFVKIPEKIEREMFDINTFAVMSLTRQLVAIWAETRQPNREILVTSSVAGKFGAPISATYSASKFALHGFFEALRSELCIMEYPIKITLACPGPVRSNIRVTAYTDTVGKQYNMPDTAEQKLVDTDRCAELMVSGLACGLDEVWIAKQPILLTLYISQYFPSCFRMWLLPFVMNKNLMKKRDGR